MAVRMKQRRGLLTEPSRQQARPSRRRCDPGLRHSLTEEHGPVEDSLTVAPRSSLHESAGFLSLVAERPPKVAVGFNPRWAITPNHLVAERRLNHRHTIGRPMDVCRRLHTFPRRSTTNDSRVIPIRGLKPTATIISRSATGNVSSANTCSPVGNTGSGWN